ncbi:MAG: hypothetical protein F4X03_12235 [Dehalococcoidia bacterium]|nr:hypothetical protein [Dehalococcoidia bacterium]MYD29657.1 hypothetical protein [Dehalococcoidia bacterium]
MSDEQTELVISHKWEPIEDLPADWRDLCRPDLHEVHQQWVADRKLVKDPAKLADFQDRLHTLWAIETGVIERLYTIDRGVTMALLEVGLGALEQFRAERRLTRDAQELIEDQRSALDFVMEYVGGRRNLTTSYIKELHQGLTRRQEHCEVRDVRGKVFRTPLLRGEWKKLPNFPTLPDGSVHEYCPPEQVQSEMDQLLSLYERHREMRVCTEVEVAWLHHRFAQIHPFQDGNGRVARSLASAVSLKADYLVLVVRDEQHGELYFDALQSADRGDLKPLVDLFADIQIRDLKEAIGAIESLRGEEAVKAVEAAAAAARRTQDVAMVRIADTLDELAGVASFRLEEVAAETERAFEREGVVVSTYVSGDDGGEHWWHRQIVKAAKQHDYFADLERPRRWVSLKLRLPAREETDTRLVISLHGVGRRAGRHAVTAFLTQPLGEGDWDTRVVSQAEFPFDAEPANDEALEAIKAEFRVWLDETITNGVRMWTEDL